MKDIELFQIALGLSSPWFVKSLELDPAASCTPKSNVNVFSLSSLCRSPEKFYDGLGGMVRKHDTADGVRGLQELCRLGAKLFEGNDRLSIDAVFRIPCSGAS